MTQDGGMMEIWFYLQERALILQLFTFLWIETLCYATSQISSIKKSDCISPPLCFQWGQMVCLGQQNETEKTVSSFKPIPQDITHNSAWCLVQLPSPGEYAQDSPKEEDEKHRKLSRAATAQPSLDQATPANPQMYENISLLF